MSRFTGPIDRQHGKWAEILLQSERSLKLTAHNKYSLLNRESLMQASQMDLSQKQKTFSEFFCAFLKLPLNIEHFQKKMAFIVYVFSKLRSPKHVVE